MVDETGGGIRIGRLRWQVTLVARQQTATVGTGGITETPTCPKVIHADVQSTTDMAFWAAQQTDTPVTHVIHVRFQDYPSNTLAIVRATQLPDGTTRTETFRVRKASELGGRKRFVRVLAQLETVV